MPAWPYQAVPDPSPGCTWPNQTGQKCQIKYLTIPSPVRQKTPFCFKKGGNGCQVLPDSTRPHQKIYTKTYLPGQNQKNLSDGGREAESTKAKKESISPRVAESRGGIQKYFFRGCRYRVPFHGRREGFTVERGKNPSHTRWYKTPPSHTKTCSARQCLTISSHTRSYQVIPDDTSSCWGLTKFSHGKRGKEKKYIFTEPELVPVPTKNRPRSPHQ